MSTVRTQADRHWVRVEYKAADSGRRRVRDIDLNMVDEIMWVFSDENEPFAPLVCGAKIYYAGEMQPIHVENWAGQGVNSANELYQIWVDFINLEDTTTPTVFKEGGIILATSTGIFK
jgi:hypothetical protein